MVEDFEGFKSYKARNIINLYGENEGRKSISQNKPQRPTANNLNWIVRVKIPSLNKHQRKKKSPPASQS